ncbi:MAG TPA: ATP-binding protein, partial [Limnochordia bacterium]
VFAAFGAVRTGWFGAAWHPLGNFRVALFAVTVAAATGFFVAGRITRRLRRLQHAVERLDLSGLTVRVPVEGEDEVASVARAFNRMVDRLAAEERVRRQLFADVAHELRHPLAVLRGRLELMQDGVVPLDEEQILILQDMVVSLSRLVADLRDLSLAEVGQLSLHLAPVDVGALIGELREGMAPVAAAKEIELAAEAPEALPRITADADRIRQVLVNLLANALHYTPPGGRVLVRAWHDPERVHVEVSDTGPGIPADEMPHIFTRFFRTDRSRSRATGGSGLGLAIVKSLVDLHGGTVRAESRVGEGTRFVVSLPLAASPRGGGRDLQRQVPSERR